MIKLEITGRGVEVGQKLHDYIEDKIGGLEKYLPRHNRSTAFATVVLIDDPNGREDNRFVCDVVLTVAGAKMVSKEGTLNIYAAVDIVAAKIHSQIRTYKEKLEPSRRRKLFGRFVRSQQTVEPEAEQVS